MTTPEVNSSGRIEELVDKVLDPIFKLTPEDKTINWAEEVQEKFKNLPKKKGQEKEIVENFLTQTAEELLQNLGNIEIAASIWRLQSDQDDLTMAQNHSTDVLKKRLVLIRQRWQDIASEQLAHFIKIYANNDLIPDFAQELLSGYFRGPKTRKQRFEAYYNFTSLVLDLAGDAKTFNEAVKIGLHDKDIISKDPYLIEQSIYISLPYGEEKRVLQQVLISKYVMEQLSTVGSHELREARRKEKTFTATSKKLEIAWKVEEAKVAKKIGRRGVMRLNGEMNDFEAALAEGRRDEESRVYKLLFDPNDPLNQKLTKAFPQMAVWK